MEDVSVDPAELHSRPVADLGIDLIGRPVTVRKLEVDGGANALPTPLLPVQAGVVERVEDSAARSGESVQQVPLPLVVEKDDVELVVEPG